MISTCWNIAVYKAIQASWRTVTAEDGDTINMNRLLFYFITTNFNKSLCFDLRRLTDSGNIEEADAKRHDRSVYSLHSVLEDIRSYREEYTRRRLFICRGLEPDLALIRRKHDEWLYAPSFKGGFVPAGLDEEPSRQCHEEWDRLCGLTAEYRTLDDCVPVEYLDLLLNEVHKMRESLFIVDKWFAHAATPISRRPVTEKSVVTPADLEQLAKMCGHLVNTVSIILGDGTYPFHTEYADDKWEDWSAGWECDLIALENAWQQWGQAVDSLQPIYPAELSK
jgi:hypothetical protein